MTKTKEKVEKPIAKMKRQEVIYKLASYVHPEQYHTVINNDTDYLKKLLSWYTNK